MIRVVIIEDEAPARRKLVRFLGQTDQEVEVVRELATLAEAEVFVKQSSDFDLIISDIQLQDGVIFDLLTRFSVHCPVIFTTAYNDFFMEAFENYGIEYLLKPFSFKRFHKAWKKFLWIKEHSVSQHNLHAQISEWIRHQTLQTQSYKSRFAAKTVKGLHFIDTSQIVCFLAEEGVVMAVDGSGKRHLLSYNTLKEIESLVDPNMFFRINRANLVNKNFIKSIERYTKNTLAVKLQCDMKPLITSQSATSSFRDWIEK